VSANGLLAIQSADAAHNAAGKLVGGLLAKSLDAHKQAGTILVEIVNAINSLNIAGLNLAAGVTNSALTGIIGKIRWVASSATEALSVLLCRRPAGCFSVTRPCGTSCVLSALTAAQCLQQQPYDSLSTG
jgi:hypothetical protein